MRKMLRKLIPPTMLTLFLLGQSTSAHAYDWMIDAKVTMIEGSYVPFQLNFQVNAGGGSCVVGTWLWWNIKGANEAQKNINAQSVYSLLLTAHVSGKTVRIFGNNSGCTIDHIYIL